jgi:cellulose synthase/poly-beta-1,6-N-acetylglucosamine synthase-like glycosyltransferase
MLEETLKALIALDYPHHTWVLDEGNDTWIESLCQKLGANHFSRKDMTRYQAESGTFQSRSKHGNYNAWLYEIGFDRYDIITVFDPDHVPEPVFLSSVLGYFEDPRIGYVQVAQAYYNQEASFIARGAAEETYAYYSSIQMANYDLGYPTIIGCHNTHRVTALKEIRGFAPHYAEDILTTLLYLTFGWQGVYIPHILARGLTPVDWSGYITQQCRWARSVLDIKFRVYPTLWKKLSFKTRVKSFVHGFDYLQGSLIMFTGLILMGFMLTTAVAPKVISYSTLPKLALLCVVLQICEFYRQRFYLDWRSEWGSHWRVALLNIAKWPYMFLPFFDVLVGRRVPYTLTRKVGAKSQSFILFWPHTIIILFICTAWIIGLVSGHIINPLLHISAAIIVITSLALILTEHFNFPDPYDKKLRGTK